MFSKDQIIEFIVGVKWNLTGLTPGDTRVFWVEKDESEYLLKWKSEEGGKGTFSINIRYGRIDWGSDFYEPIKLSNNIDGKKEIHLEHTLKSQQLTLREI